MTRIVISGILGRMGTRIAELARKDKELEVIAGLELKEDVSQNIAGSLDGIKKNFDCIIEFTSPTATLEHLKKAEILKKPMVIGTTGFTRGEAEAIKSASRTIPIVFAPNMSVGVNVFLNTIKRAAAALGGEYNVSIRESHHAHKKDRPSGTAKLMAQKVKDELGDIHVPIESVRQGEIIGDHAITFESDVDVLKISHSAKTRDIFALGALQAAKFVVTKKNGLFTMQDVLGLEE